MENRKVFILNTPLHSLIANKIIELNRFKNTLLIFVNRFNENKKMEHYSVRSKFTKRYIEGNPIKILFYFLKELNKKDDIYFGNPFLFENRLLIKYYPSGIFTYDDGYCNIDFDSDYYLEKKGIKGWIFRLLGVPKHKIKTIFKKHYSIFHGKPNVIENVEYLKLFANVIGKPSDLPLKKILIGSTYFEDAKMSLENEKELYGEVISKYNIDHYIPHPRESNIKVDIKIIRTDLVAEDYVIRNLNRNTFEIYGYTSTVLFNLENVEGVSVSYLPKPVLNNDIS